MANVNCQSVQNLTTHSADVSGTGDFIPVSHFLRIAYGVTSGGPFNTFTAPDPGTNSPGQLYSVNISNLIPGVTYYYIIQELDTDGITVIAESGQCQFKTRDYTTTCETVAFTETSITVKVCADFVAPGQTLDFIYGPTPGGPYPNNGGSVPGDDTKGQCAIFTISLTPCEIIYYRGSVTNVPATYEVDWSYAHRNRTAGPETAELRLGPENTYPLGQTLVDTDTASGPGSWHHRTGTYPVPLNITQLHMGFVSTQGPGPAVGNFLDSCSIILRRVLPSPLVIGEQLLNGGFEFPVQPAGVTFVPETTPGLAWKTTDPTNVLEYWKSGTLGVPADSGAQFVELNAFNPAELSQVVTLAVATADSQECVASTFNLDCDPGTNVTCIAGTLNARYCGLPENYSVQFQYSTSLGGPFFDAGPVQFVSTLSSADVPVATGSGPLAPNTQYFYRLVARDKLQNIIGTSETCNFTTLDCVLWCGGYHDPNDCILVDPGNGEPTYFNCNQV